MKTKILFIFLSLLFKLNINAQPPKHVKAGNDLTPFVGTWVATKDDMKYEITFKEGIRGLEINGNKHTIEVIFASCVKWIKNGEILREFKTDAPVSILEGFISDVNPLFLSSVVYYDKEKKYNGNGTFTIDNAKNPQKAKWTHYPSYIGKNRGKTDFPYFLDFIKVE